MRCLLPPFLEYPEPLLLVVEQTQLVTEEVVHRLAALSAGVRGGPPQ
jgi:hypothetical protein